MAGGKGCGCDQKGVAPGRSLGGGPVCTLTFLVTGISMNFYALLNDTELHTHTHTHTHDAPVRISSLGFVLQLWEMEPLGALDEESLRALCAIFTTSYESTITSQFKKSY